jgi:hypothetical protein
MARGGALVFKGDKPSKKKKKSKHSSKQHASSSEDHEVNDTVVRHPTTETLATATTADASLLTPPQVQMGTGTITTSGTVVTGHGTKFTSQLRVGDALLLSHDEKTDATMRVITMILSDTSLNMSTALLTQCELRTPTTYQFIAKPRNMQEEARQQKKQKDEQSQLEKQHAFGTYAATTELVYREKTEHGGYRIRREQVDGGSTTRGDLLHMRTKKKSDKYC